LEEEVTAFIGAAPYERSQQRRDHRNGHYTRQLETTGGQVANVPVPRTRGGYQTQSFERYHRRRDELDGAIGELVVTGVSTAKVGEVVETLTGSHPSASTVSRVFHTLESEYEQWKQRKLAERYVYAEASGTYFTVISTGQGCKMPILAVVRIAETGERDVLAFRVGDRANEQAWKYLLADLKARGVKAIDLWVSDGSQATMGAISKEFPASARQRCVVHTMDNVREPRPKPAARAAQTRIESLVLSEGSTSR